MSDMEHRWDRRWRDKLDSPFLPDPWLLKVLHLLPTGRALDIASGRGRNALFLAERDWSVTAIDRSREALAQLEREAVRRHLPVETVRFDLEAEPRLPAGDFDLVIDFFYLHRPLLPAILRAVSPGGAAVVRTFTSAGPFAGGPGNPDFVLDPGELLATFAGWEILLHEEGLEPSRKGGALAGIVARRPVG